MGKILARDTSLRNPETGERENLYAGDELPEWAEESITNPKLFVSDDDVVQDSGSDDGLDRTTVPNLINLAEEEGIELGDARKKAEIIEVIRAAREADEEANSGGSD